RDPSRIEDRGRLVAADEDRLGEDEDRTGRDEVSGTAGHLVGDRLRVAVDELERTAVDAAGLIDDLEALLDEPGDARVPRGIAGDLAEAADDDRLTGEP